MRTHAANEDTSSQPFDDPEVTAVWRSTFGIVLFNLYTANKSRPKLLFSQRTTIVRRMIRAMLDAEQEIGS